MDAEETRAVERADEVRRVVASQLTMNLILGEMTGSRALFVARLRSLAAAEGRGDPDALRAAWLDLAEAAALNVVSLDLLDPAERAATLRR